MIIEVNQKMKRSMFLLATLTAIAICIVLVSGCLEEPGAGGEQSAPPATPNATGPVFGPGDNGGNVTVASGTAITLRLPENPTTGYRWNMTPPEGLTVLKDEFLAPDTQLIGAGGTHEWVISAEKPGNYTLHAEYRRPWVSSGTIVFVPLEGGFFGIAGNDGRNYLPLDLGQEFRVDGLRVAFEAEEATDTATIQMWGTPVNVTSIEAVETYDLAIEVT